MIKNISKDVLKFLLQNGIDINNIPDTFNFDIKGRKEANSNDFNYTLTIENINYKNEVEKTVSIKDIIGSFNLWNNEDFLSTISEIFDEKSLGNLDENVLEDLNSNSTIKLLEENGKYYVIKDYSNRTLYLLTAYLILKEKNKNNPEELKKLDDKFKIKAEVTKKSGYEMIDKICFCLSKVWNSDIKIDFNYENALAKVTVLGETYIINQEDEFINIFNYYLSKLNKESNHFKALNSWLVRVGYPDKILKAEEEIKNREFVDKETLLKVKEYLEGKKEITEQKQNIKIKRI